VDIVKLLHDRLLELHDRYADTPYAPNFPRSSFKVRLPNPTILGGCRGVSGTGAAGIAWPAGVCRAVSGAGRDLVLAARF
jgi:hypothetical protein